MFSCATPPEVLSAYNEAIAQLVPEVRQRLTEVLRKYVVAFGVGGVYERFNGRTVAQVLAEFQEPVTPPVVCSGELDGLRYTLYRPCPVENKGTRDSNLPQP